MSVIGDSQPIALHLHTSSNMLHDSTLRTPQPSRSEMTTTPRITQGLHHSSDAASPSNSLSSASQLRTIPDNFESNQSTLQYLPAGTPSASTSENDFVTCTTDIPLLTTFPAAVPPSLLADLASSSQQCTDKDGKSSGLDVVSVLLSEDSGIESQSLESMKALVTDSALSTSVLQNATEFRTSSLGEGRANVVVCRVDGKANTSLVGSNPHTADLKGENGLGQEDGQPLHDNLSVPASMPSSDSTLISGNGSGDLSPVGDMSTSEHEMKVLKDSSVHLLQNIFENAEDVASDEAVGRTKSMPAPKSESVHSARFLRRSSTEKRRRGMNTDNVNVRVTPEFNKLSDRRKKKLLRKLATIKKDGVVEFDVGDSSQAAKDLFGYGFSPVGDAKYENDDDGQDEKTTQEEYLNNFKSVPPLRIVMLIVGTRGDVQPFIAIGRKLQEHGHRVRLASHKNFEGFVKSGGLEFYPLGGDPVVLAGYMVKNKGFLPSNPAEIPVQRQQIKSIVHSLLPACTQPDLASGIPFQAQAIIANPPAYGHVHVAEFLKIPLHIFFTMPWTPTSAFPHPLSRVKQPAGYRMSYQIVDTMIWLGIRGIINSYRKKKLKLRPITYFSGSHGSIAEMPTGYIWSPHLVPKPRDWGSSVDVVGFCFLNLATDYKPPEDLVNWLKAGSPPIYIGFGSLPVEDPEGMTKIIVEALNKTGQRGIIGKGWGGIGNLPETPENIFLLSDCPHDWLFPQCAGVIHHGGAGTTSAGLKAACPTTIIPFFGDQPFWGDRVHEKGVGPAPIPVNHLTLERLVNAIEKMLDPVVKQAALDLSKAMENEDGVEGAVNAFHKHIRHRIPQTVSSREFHRPSRRYSYRRALFKWTTSCLQVY